MIRMKTFVISFVCCLLAAQHQGVQGTTLADRSNCGANDAIPETRVNTTGRLASFRTSLAGVRVSNRPISAFIVGSADAHNSEYPTTYDQRREYISGFGGSAGTAVITATKAALWTDGRYFLEADEVLDCNWILMKDGLADTPSIAEWINSEMPNPGEYVGVDETLISHTSFTDMEETLIGMSNRPELKAIPSAQNPVDSTWTTDRPARPTEPINVLPLTFAGVSWEDKITNLRAKLTTKGVKAFAVTALDEIAWLFNLRGSDVSYNPFFLAYAIVEDTQTRLYILNKDARLVASPTDPDSDKTLASHLSTSTTGSCIGVTGPCVEVLDYVQDDVETALNSITLSGSVWITYEANYAIYSSVTNNRVIDKSPIALEKSMKNSVERTGMQNAYNRDSTALIKFLAFLEKQIQAGETWTEVTAANELDKRRGNLENSRGLSFPTISGYGSNGAIIHYRPSNLTDKTISTDSLYLLDSGGQYLDGTTDVTRTMHYGTPSDYEKECYTRVLMSAINLATLQWPEGLYGRQIDALARYQLWDAGLVYRHGTGHGIGAYLSVHEGPGSISLTTNIRPSREPLTQYQYYSDGPGRIYMMTEINPSREPLSQYQYYSDEPGYYEDGKFGIRLETIVMVNPVTPKYTTANQQFYEFKPVTFVPFETNLIDYSLMNPRQVDWLNDYNSQMRTAILPLLADDRVALDWFNARTQQLSISFNSAHTLYSSTTFLVVLATAVIRLVA